VQHHFSPVIKKKQLLMSLKRSLLSAVDVESARMMCSAVRVARAPPPAPEPRWGRSSARAPPACKCPGSASRRTRAPALWVARWWTWCECASASASRSIPRGPWTACRELSNNTQVESIVHLKKNVPQSSCWFKTHHLLILIVRKEKEKCPNKFPN